MKDILGNELNIGDKVAIAIAAEYGRGIHLRTGEIKAMNTGPMNNLCEIEYDIVQLATPIFPQTITKNTTSIRLTESKVLKLSTE